MCFDSPDPSAAAAQQTALLEQQNAKHNADIKSGQKSITDAFAQFDPAYFSKYQQAYKDNYNPQLTTQYGEAQDKLTALLAGNGQLGGSVGNEDLARLSRTYNNSQADIANSASDAANNLKSNVSNTENNLFSLNASAADPTLAAQQAQAAAGTIVSPQSYPTLSNVFGNALSSVATASRANSNSLYGPYAQNTGAPNNFAPV